MSELPRGLYEKLITEELESALQSLGSRHRAKRTRLHHEEAPDRVALHLATLVRRALSGIGDSQRGSVGVQLARQITELLAEKTNAVDTHDLLSPAAEVLQAISALQIDGREEDIPLPATPLLDTTLLTNAPGEPRIGFQLNSEMHSADRIDVLMAFVRKSGIRPMLKLLQRHVERGHRLRLLTTTYTNSTEMEALEQLRDIGAEVRVSYDISTSRLHAKAWLFHRKTGFSTAYIGSSNLTHSAQVAGLEWNVRISGARNPDVIDKFDAVFESYWESSDFRPFDADEFWELTKIQPSGPRIYLSPVEIKPEPFQARLLELIELSRLRGYHRNLLVSATGTGKTVMAALDYQRLRSRLPRARLLFVAHRQEILEQSLATFRHALRDAAFGELWVAGARPTDFDHVFASIQSLSAASVTNLPPDHFDVVIIDEFHHAAAPTYRALLEHVVPSELLGLTATPERADGEPILQWFGGRIAAELRLWDAIDQHRLVPFAYYGVHDGTDYSKITWRRGRGYDPEELSNLVTGDQVLARRIIQSVTSIVSSPESMRALCFCVSVAHARFMADQFNAVGLTSKAITGDTPREIRRQSIEDMKQGRLRVLVSVDIFNEGVDIPAIDTLLLLRPTDSPTVFLQQLGRGLRKGENKSICTVLDFVGQHHREFKLYRRFGAILGGGREQIKQQVVEGFPFLPSGCHMELDSVASQLVIENIRESLPSTWRAKAEELRRVAEADPRVTLKNFLDQSGLELDDVYANNRSWSDLMQAGGLAMRPRGPHEEVLRRALGRLLHVNDSRRIEGYKKFALSAGPVRVDELDPTNLRLFHMLVASLTETVLTGDESLADAAELLWQHPQVLAELAQLMDALEGRVDHVHHPLPDHPDVPLYVHARYTRREALAALAHGDAVKLATWREGARWFPDHQIDLFTITFDKTNGRFSPTTRYRDYAISSNLLHWESQSTIREDSPTGRRYQNHVSISSTILPMARLSTEDRAFWFLGPASYVSHEGERPMAVTWRLRHPIPGDLYTKFCAAIG